jgi:Zn-dependent protease with chaperone function
MNRDLVLIVLAFIVCGPVVWLGGPLSLASLGVPGGIDERRAWRRLWMPVMPAAVALAVLAGWGLQEPARTDELLRPVAGVLVVPVVLLWLRAAWRVTRALRRPAHDIPAAVVGLFRPRILLSTAFREAVDERALAAALAHEQAHARHRDPLRILLAQLVSDLQWPAPGARIRLQSWLAALEVARDDEARRHGSDGRDLAAAILAAARLTVRTTSIPVALLTSAEWALVFRIDRLLSAAVPGGDRRGWGWLLVVGLAAAITAGAVVGVTHGDDVLRALPVIAGA